MPRLLCSLLVFALLCGQVKAQTTTYYHYASASKSDSLYISEVTPIAFNSTYHPLTDNRLKTNLAEQYLNFLHTTYGDSLQFKFSTYAMSRSKPAVTKARAKELATAKVKRYTVITVKDFSYD